MDEVDLPSDVSNDEGYRFFDQAYALGAESPKHTAGTDEHRRVVVVVGVVVAVIVTPSCSLGAPTLPGGH
jgi:hypothetical protein